MSTISTALRQQVAEAAGHRCEYCLSPQQLVFDILQIDHIHPTALGGVDIFDNLCLACSMCNRHKSTQVSAIDPFTGIETALFNPRVEYWVEHFRWSADGTQILGITACGRATVIALNMNNHIAVRVRREWVSAGWHPPHPR